MKSVFDSMILQMCIVPHDHLLLGNGLFGNQVVLSGKKTNQHVFFRRCVFQKVQVHEQQSSRKCLWIPSPSHENQPLSNPIPIEHPNGPNSSQWCGNSIHPPWFRPPAFPKASLTGALSSVASHPYGFDKQDLYPIILNHIDDYI